MKRLFFSLLMAGSLFVAAAPVHVAVTPAHTAQVAVNTAVAACDVKLSVKITNDPGGDCISNSGEGGAIVAYLKLILKVLSGLVGVTVVLMFVVAGIQYITSAGDPANIKKAKERIVNAVTALILFIMGFAILNFLIPGGIFS